MFDDAGDLDHNGIPDAIQRDPVVVPEPFDLFGDPPDTGLPGITAPVETLEPDEAPGTDLPDAPDDMDNDVILDRSRTATKAADAMDGYIKS